MKWSLGKPGVGSALALLGVAALTGGVVSLLLHDDGTQVQPAAAAADRDGPREPGIRHFRMLTPKQVLERRKRFHAELAKELDVSTEKVDQAFKTLLERRLDRAVDSGRLTRKQANRLLECYDSAECKPPFRHRLRFRGPPPAGGPPPGAPPPGGPEFFGPPM